MAEMKSKISNSGLVDLLETKTFSNYEVKEKFQEVAKKAAIEYTKEFLKGDRYSFAFLGQSGIGKTHLLTAISKEMIDRNIDVKYYVADEIIQILQACKFDEENYNREFGKIANAGVLFIDDLFKASITNYYKEENLEKNDLREIFKVINYRYNKKLPILLSSEVHFERFRNLDQAIIGRVNEMCDYRYLISVKPDENKNYRLARRNDNGKEG
jgi:DNA replication protein DnaC